MGPVFTEPR
jgi:ribonuclease HI